MTFPRRIAPALLAFVVGSLLATSVVAAVAASSSTSAKACRTKSGALRLLKGRTCPKHSAKFTFAATGPAGPAGVTGAPGAAGVDGKPGPQGPAGKDATVPATGSIAIPGSSFAPVASTTGYALSNRSAIYENAGIDFLSAAAQGIPAGAKVTTVDFHLRHQGGGQATIAVDSIDPATAERHELATATPTAAAGGIQTATLSLDGFVPSETGVPVLLWQPGNTGIAETFAGAVVHWER